MPTWTKAGRFPLAALLIFAGCTHSDAFVTPVSTVGPFNTGADVLLTLNPDQDYWPAWTQDGRAVLYAFVDVEHPLHRCLGMLAPLGGTRLWQLCDNRAVRDDSTNSYSGFAVDSTGRLLVAEAVSPAHSWFSVVPHSTTLWLADTARPFARVPLLALPQTIGNTVVSWVSDIRWTGPNTFIALGEQLFPDKDSVFVPSPGVVFRGTIAANHATVQAVAGTQGVTGYSFAENGATIVFTASHDLRLFTVPAGGGVPLPEVPVRDDTLSHQKGELLGVSCRGETCIVAKGAILLAGDYWILDPRVPSGWNNTSSLGAYLAGQMELHSVSLTSGADVILRVDTTHVVFATPQLSPLSGDLLLQIGGGWGHLQTYFRGGTNSALHLYRALVP